ncbi:MAG: hydroxysqualene dehydroxylase HpnE, partial [Solirubrobacteraceae bacterium]
MAARRIAVVGGGLAGIATALDCARAGADVTLLESRPRLGGAAFSFVRDGLQMDNGQHVFLRCCTEYRRLLDEIGASDLVTLQRRMEIPVLAPGGRRALLRRCALPAPLHMAPALARYGMLEARERIGAARTAQALRHIDRDDPANDARSFGDWLAERGQVNGTLTALWDLVARPTLNLDPAQASLAQAAQVFQVGLLADRSAADIGYARVPLSQIHDIRAQRALAAAGVEIRLRRGVTGLTRTAAGYDVEISAGPTVKADAVVLAVPPDRARRLLPPDSGVAAADLIALGRSPIVNLHVFYDRQVLDAPFAACVHSPVQWIFDRTASSGRDHGQYVVVSLSAAEAELSQTADELRERYLPALADVLATDAEVEGFLVTREHSATFRAGPGARAHRPGPRTALPGLVLAGSWTDTGWPATMEGAVRSGHAAARAALATAPRSAQPRAA